MLVGADVLNRKAPGGRGIMHQRPLSELALPGSLKVEIGWRRSDGAFPQVDGRGSVVGRQSGATPC
jgi:hypothetical protein